MGFVNVSHGNTDYGGNIVNNLNLHQEGMFKKESGAKQNLYTYIRDSSKTYCTVPNAGMENKL